MIRPQPGQLDGFARLSTRRHPPQMAANSLCISVATASRDLALVPAMATAAIEGTSSGGRRWVAVGGELLVMTAIYSTTVPPDFDGRSDLRVHRSLDGGGLVGVGQEGSTQARPPTLG